MNNKQVILTVDSIVTLIKGEVDSVFNEVVSEWVIKN